MAEEKNIKNYSAADIEKYWSGKLSGKEMHHMEKAAMDDPFLADALEGYQYSSAAQSELGSLKEKLETRSGSLAPVINLKKKKYPWLRVAAAIIIITGAGLLAQQLLFKQSGEKFIGDSKTIQNKTPEQQELNKQEIKSDTVQALPAKPDGSLDTSKVNIVGSTNNAIGNSRNYLNVGTDSIKSSLISDDVKNQLEEKKDAAAITSPVAKSEEREKGAVKEGKGEFFAKDRDGIADSLNANYKKASPSAKQKSVQGVFNDKYSNFATLDNRYNYRVVDAQNNPVPFANVMNTRDNVGTYTDIRGNFNLVSSDSILDVQVRSLGYNASNFKLVPSKQTGDIVLKEDDNARQQILANNRKVVSNVTRKDSANYEEPEVGWGYYNTYVANNFQVPEAALTKNRGNEVELKFDIDKNGQPINIRITRSSQCKECDEEAIRLLKEGPKWKRKGRKSKGSVTIAVDK